MRIEEIAEAEQTIRDAMEIGGECLPLPLAQKATQAAWVLARAWLADECSADLVVSTVREDDGEKE